MSLKANLNQIIKDRAGEVFTLRELTSYCQTAGYKLSNAERRLRASESPNVQPVYNDKRTAIVGYRWLSATLPSYKANEFLEKYPSQERQPVKTLF